MTRQFLQNSALSLLGIALLSQPALAKSWVDKASTENRIAAKVVKDDMVMMRTDIAFKEVRVANAEVADVVVLTDRSFQLLGKASGKTNVMLYDAEKRLVDIVDVTVGYDLAGLKKSLFESFPNEKIEVRAMANGIFLSGDVAKEDTAVQAEKIAQAYAPEKVTNGLTIRDSHQVMLEVRFVEASRDVVKSLGIGLLTQRFGDFAFQSGVAASNPFASGILQGGFGTATLDARIDALEENGVIRTLAEPNLVSMSGETASFLAGGEFPIPVRAEDNEVTIEFRQFGVGLAFTPTVLDDAVINLKVAPEVSQLDMNNAVRVGGVEVPALRVRRANTTIELRNDQSFAIAGLLQNETTNTKSQAPWIGDIPVVGSLFRSTKYQKAETELVIIVTPRLVQPVSDISQLATPLDKLTVPGDAEAFLTGSLEGPARSAGGLSSEYGHVLE